MGKHWGRVQNGSGPADEEEAQEDFVTAQSGREVMIYSELADAVDTRKRHYSGQPVALARFDRSGRFQRFLLDSSQNVLEAWRIFRRLGLPEAILKNKLPYFDQCLKDEKADRVYLPPHMVAAMKANKTNFARDTAERRKPKFRTHAPGLGTVIAANVLLIWICMRARI